MITWSETDLMVRDAVRSFIASEITPVSAELESGELPPYDVIRKLFASFGIDAMAAEGFDGLMAAEATAQAARSDAAEGKPTPEDRANKRMRKIGAQLPMGLIALSELSGAALGLVASATVSLGLGAGTIMARGTTEQKQRWARDVLTMKKVAAWAITEPDAGSDAFGGMSTYVRRDGEDYILNGQKTFITNGPYADVAVVYAKLDEGDASVDRRDRKVLTFVLDAGMEGFTQSQPFKKMGLGSSPTGAFFFDNVRLGKDRLLGGTEEHKGGDGRDSARLNFVVERVGCAVLALGIIERCHQLCVDYSRERTLWGQEIGRFQLIQLKLAEMEVARMNVRNMLFQTIAGVREGTVPTLGEASAMKYYSTKVCSDATMEAVQLFGGNGYMAEYEVERLARDAKALCIFAGSNEIQVTHIAKSLLAGTK